MKVTMRDVARKAGVSVSTVSLVVNSPERVSPPLLQKVLKVIDELDYRGNHIARSLRTKETQVLGLIIPDITNPFFPAVVRGVEDAAFEYGYTIFLSNSDGDAEKEKKLIDTFKRRLVDGLILVPSERSEESYDMLKGLEMPLVVVDRRIGTNSFTTVVTDNRLGGEIATRHLIQNGNRRIALISGSLLLRACKDRKVGYVDALQSSGYEIDPQLIYMGDLSLESGRTAVTHFLENNISFDAIFAMNDLMALGAISHLMELGKGVPDSVDVVGYDDIFLSAAYRPSLTTVRQPGYEMGWESVNLLVSAINSSETQCEIVRVLEPELILRHSTKNYSGI